jgi:hypothetical protein
MEDLAANGRFSWEIIGIVDAKLANQNGKLSDEAGSCTGSCTSPQYTSVQMGGPEGVRAAERDRISISPVNGMWLHCTPRG